MERGGGGGGGGETTIPWKILHRHDHNNTNMLRNQCLKVLDMDVGQQVFPLVGSTRV